MAADLSYWTGIASNALMVFFFAVVAVVVCAALVCVCIFVVEKCLRWPRARLRVFRLGGVTTLTRSLDYPCTLCRDSMEAGEMVRTLSCGHAFHCGGSVKCENDIDRWLSTGLRTSCPNCRQVPHPVLPGTQPPPASPSTSATDLEAALLPSSHNETLAEASSAAPAHDETPAEASSSAQPHDETPAETSSSAPAHDETPAETSSSASVLPLAQLARTTSAPDSEVLPLLPDDEIQPAA